MAIFIVSLRVKMNKINLLELELNENLWVLGEEDATATTTLLVVLEGCGALCCAR